MDFVLGFVANTFAAIGALILSSILGCLIGATLGPYAGVAAFIIVLFIVMAMSRPREVVVKENTTPTDAQPGISDDTRACPQCAETIKKAANMCRFCGCDLLEKP